MTDPEEIALADRLRAKQRRGEEPGIEFAIDAAGNGDPTPAVERWRTHRGRR